MGSDAGITRPAGWRDAPRGRGWLRARTVLSAALLALVALVALPRRASAFDPRPDPGRYAVRTWTTGDGLPVGVILAAIQTRDGYLWLGTEEGLVRFDGVRFSVFRRRNTPELEASYVRGLYEDEAGALWVATYGSGLLRRDRDGRFTRIAGAAELGTTDVRNVVGDGHGTIYIATDDGALACIQGGKVSRLEGPEADSTQIDVAPDGALWVAHRAHGASRFKDGVWTHFTTKDGLSSDPLNAVHAARDGAVYFGTKLGKVDRLEGGRVTTFDLGTGASGEPFSIGEDHEGTVWVGTADAGLHTLRAGVHRAYGLAEGLPNTKVFAVFEDRERNVWAATLQGLARLKRAAFTTYDDAPADQPGTFVWSVFEDATGGILLGSQAHGVELHRPGVPTQRWAKAQGVDSDEIATLLRDRAGDIWGGTRIGLNRIHDGKVTTFGVKDGLPDGSPYALYEDRHGDLWIGTYGAGLGRRRDGVFTAYTRANGYPMDHTLAITEDASGILWVGGQQGAGRFVEGVFAKAPSPPGDFVLTLHPDPSGVMWMGMANGGLARLDGTKLTTISTREGLFADTVFSIFEDHHGFMWMSSNLGIFRVAKKELEAFAAGTVRSVTSIAYGKEDGLRTFECNGGGTWAGFQARDGRMWFATAEGAAVVDPDRLPHNDAPPPVTIEEARVDDAPLAEGGRAPPGSRAFELRYAAASFVAPSLVRFKYRLDGFDAAWVDAGARRIAYYTNLPPGEYTFRVLAANEDGVWNEEGARFSFVLAPRFHETKTFALLALAALAGSIALVVRVRVRTLAHRAATLEARVAERTAELEGANAALATRDRRIHEDLLQARAFQRRLLPPLPDDDARLRFAVAYEPADVVGGDVYDVCALGDGRFRIFLADTTGHGVQASLRTMVLKTEYDRLKRAVPAPGALLAALNDVLVASFPDLELRCSAVCLDVDVAASPPRVVYANAAHPPVLHVTRGEAREIYAGSGFLGMMSGMAFPEETIVLAAGDRLIGVTDALFEAQDDAGAELGLERLAQIAAAEADAPLDVAVDALVAAARAHAAPRPLDDDATVVAVEVVRR